MLWRPEDLQRWAANEREVLSAARTRPHENIYVQPPSGGGSGACRRAVVTELTSTSTIKIRLLDGAGAPSGPELHCDCFPLGDFDWGDYPTPSLALGDTIPVMQYSGPQSTGASWCLPVLIVGTCAGGTT